MPTRKTGGWFFDSVVLSNFALTDSLGVLTKRYRGRFFITSQVLDEIAMGISAGHHKLRRVLQLVDGGHAKTMQIGGKERSFYQELLGRLGEGEASTIATARSKRGIVVTDDRAARSICDDHSVPFTGTIGILKSCVKDHTMPIHDADALLSKMIIAGFYSPVRRISDIL
jgi:predicted nucleic acid-binding protein